MKVLGNCDVYKRSSDNVLPDIKAFQETGILQDLDVVCGSGPAVRTSAVLLAAISPWLRRLMEEAGEEFCLCLPSISSDMFTEYLSTCLTPSSETMALNPSHVHHLIQHLKVEKKKDEEMDMIKPEVKLEYEEDDWEAGFESEDELMDLDYDPSDCNISENNTEKEKGSGTKKDRPIGTKKEKSDKMVQKDKKKGRPKGTTTPNGPNAVVCDQCGFEATGNSKAEVHQRHMLKHEVENFSCDCPDAPKLVVRPDSKRVGKDFRDKERHMKVEHQGWVGCQECRDCFKTQEDMERHQKKHLNKIVCDQCGYEATNKTNLMMHKTRYHEEAGETCSECGKLYKGIGALKMHQKQVHTSSTCNICGLVVKQLHLHMQSIHMDDSEKRYHCEDCGKGFMSINQMERHRVNMHIKSQPYQCRYGCENRYNDTCNRNAHERRRHGELYELKKQSGGRKLFT